MTAADASAQAANSSLSIPVPLQREATAAPNIYNVDEHAIDEPSEELAGMFAAYGGVALANMHLYEEQGQMAEQLQTAMHSRAVIEQAKGILMAQRRCSAEDAFTILIHLSQDTNRKLRDVAQALVEHAQGSEASGWLHAQEPRSRVGDHVWCGCCQTEQFSREVDLCCRRPECGTRCAARHAERRGIACRSMFEESSSQGEVELSNGQAEQVAVFFDFENLAIGARRDMPSLGQESVSAPALKLLCQQRGSATIRRAYADWGQPQFAPYQEALALNGIDLIQVKRFGIQQKNAADIRMAVDAMEALITHPEISTYILVAGDGDYSPLVQRLREYGKTVIGVGTEASASPRLVAVCSEYKYWGTLVAEANPAVRQSVQAEFDIKVAIDVLLGALDAMADTTVDGWTAAGPLKNRMLNLYSAFDNANYGARTFTAFLTLPRVEEKIETKRRDDGQTLARRRVGDPMKSRRRN